MAFRRPTLIILVSCCVLFLCNIGSARGRFFQKDDDDQLIGHFMPLCHIAPSGACTYDLNPCGHSGFCQCPGGYRYDARIYRCVLDDVEGVDAKAAGTTETARGDDGAHQQIPVDNKCVRRMDPGPCTMDVNACGNPSSCACPKGFEYDAMIGLCLVSSFLDEDVIIHDLYDSEGGSIDYYAGEYDDSVDYVTQDAIACAASAVPAGVSKCSRDINECGYPTVCECPIGYRYDARLGPLAGCLLEEGEDAVEKSMTSGTLEAALATVALKIFAVDGSMCIVKQRDMVGMCTMDLNQCGHSSFCECPEGFEYNDRVAMCLRIVGYLVSDEAQTEPAIEEAHDDKPDVACAAAAVDRRCTRDVNECGFPTVCQCPDGYSYDARLGPMAGCLLMMEEDPAGEEHIAKDSRAAVLAEIELKSLAEGNDLVCVKRVEEGPCTADLNMCGHSSTCVCAAGFEYDARVAMCLKASTAKGKNQQS